MKLFPASRQVVVSSVEGISLAEAGNITLFTPPSQGLRINPTHVILDIVSVNSTLSVDAQVSVDTGVDDEDIVTVKTLTGAAEGRSFVLLPVDAATGMSRVVTGGDVVRLRKQVLAVGKATTTRARENNIATVGITDHGLVVGDVVIIGSLGGTGYNGKVTVSRVPDANTIQYVSVGANETETADIEGRVGNLIVNATIIAVG